MDAARDRAGFKAAHAPAHLRPPIEAERERLHRDAEGSRERTRETLLAQGFVADEG